MKVITGDSDPAHTSTSFVGRQNLTMRMSMGRFTRLTNAVSKKLDNHVTRTSPYFMYLTKAQEIAIGAAALIATGLVVLGLQPRDRR